MKFNNHFDLSGKHAFLSASKYAWIRYEDEKLIETFRNHQAAMLGTRLHAFASEAIALGIKMPRTTKTLNQFVNDVLGYHMSSEQTLYYSENVFGTADAISFRKNLLRIFDLKTGTSKASMDQLLIYSALFCLEYKYKPADIEIELRLYQNDEVVTYIPVLEDIVPIIDKIIAFDKLITRMKSEADEL